MGTGEETQQTQLIGSDNNDNRLKISSANYVVLNWFNKTEKDFQVLS